MKKVVSILILFVLCLFAMTGCKESEKDGFVNVTDAAKSADDVLQANYENITFDENFEVTVPKEIGEYQLVREDSFNEDGESVPKYFLGDKFDSQFLKTSEESDSEYIYEDKKKEVMVFTAGNGYCYYEEGDTSWQSYKDEGEAVFLNSDYDEDTKYPVQGGEMSISDVVKAAQDYTEQYANQYGDLTFAPYVIYMKEEKDGNYGFVVYFTISYNGVNFSTLQNDIYSEESDSNVGVDISQDITDNRVYINSTDGISGFYDGFGLLKYEKTEKKVEQVISFKRAAEIADDKIKDDTCHNIINAQLEYQLVLEKYDADKAFYLLKSGYVFKTKPYWVFYTGKSQEQAPESCITVDCVTGECK